MPKGQNFVVLFTVRHTFDFHAIFQNYCRVQIQTWGLINTPLKLLWTADVLFGGYKTETKHSGGNFEGKKFLAVVTPPSECCAAEWSEDF